MSTYCWYRSDCESELHGPFDTVKEALDDVPGCFDSDEDAPITVAEVEEILPEDYADTFGVDDQLDRMEEATTEVVMVDDNIFDVPANRREEAEAALADALIAWAREYVEADGTWTAAKVVKEATVKVIRVALAIADPA